MDSEHIEQLLEKYWNCQTTLEEEKLLEDYFASTPATEGQKEAAAMFLYFRQSRQKELEDRSFDTRVLRSLKKPSAQLRTFMFNTMRIAAGVVVLLLAVWLVRLEIRESDPDIYADTYNDPDRAFQETKKALMMISKSFSTAEEQARKINLFNEAQQELRASPDEVDM